MYLMKTFCKLSSIHVKISIDFKNEIKYLKEYVTPAYIPVVLTKLNSELFAKS